MKKENATTVLHETAILTMGIQGQPVVGHARGRVPETNTCLHHR